MSRKILYLAVALVPAQSAGLSNAGQGGSFQPHNPVVFANPFPVIAQTFSVYGKPYPPPDGWAGQQLDYQFAKPFPTSAQQFQTTIYGTIRSTTPQGFQGQQLDYSFAKPFAPALQQFTAYFKQPEAITPQGWWPYPPVVFAKPFPVTEQQYTTSPNPQQFLPGFGWHGYQFDYQFKEPFPAAQQQFQAWTPQVVPLYFPPGSGRRKDFPSYIPQPAYDEKPNKPFRPVWDKPKQGKVEQPAPAAPARPPLPPAELFGQPGQAGDAKVNAPMALDLPSFDQYLPDDMEGQNKQMQEAQDLSDAMTLLKRLGLIPEG